MSLGIGPLPTVFYQAALNDVLNEVDMSAEGKKALADVMLQRMIEADTSRSALRYLRAIVYGSRWRCVRAEEVLRAQGIEPDEDEVLSLLFNRASSGAHQLYRRGQIRSALKGPFGGEKIILISVSCGDSEMAHCGAKYHDTLEPTSLVLSAMPPCDPLACECHWFVCDR